MEALNTSHTARSSASGGSASGDSASGRARGSNPAEVEAAQTPLEDAAAASAPVADLWAARRQGAGIKGRCST